MLGIIIWALLGPAASGAGRWTQLDEGNKEYEIKAAFIFNFAEFTQWPDSAFASRNSPFVVAVIGDDPFGPALREVMDGKSIAGHPMTVKHLDSPRQIAGCHLAVHAGFRGNRLTDIFNAVEQSADLNDWRNVKVSLGGGNHPIPHCRRKDSL